MADVEKLRKNLEREGFVTSYFETGEEACAYLDQKLDGTTIGFGGSVTVQELGLYDKLATHNTCLWHWQNSDVLDASRTHAYLCSLNGVSENGELINIDGSGNRVASGLFGHQELYFVIGVNKIAPDFESALWRARNIAAPKNAQRLGCKTPCAVNGDRCYDCDSEERICAALTVYWRKPKAIPHVEVVIVNQDLGY